MVRKLTLSALLLAGILLAAPALAQEEVTSGSRYGDREVSSGYYEEYEVRPGRASPFLQRGMASSPGYKGQGFDSRSGINRFKADAHAGIPNYGYKRCADCHQKEAMNNKHVTRRNISCSQCHGREPIAGVEHYFSPLNPIRRHAYVCSKCHQGANASFARYLVHEPNPFAEATLSSFPKLYYSAWGMLFLVLGTLAFFLSHTGIWVIRDLFTKNTKKGVDDEN
ncbi:MAG: cytochrome c3 family protein [Pseudodesulfovibrio sp.]